MLRSALAASNRQQRRLRPRLEPEHGHEIGVARQDELRIRRERFLEHVQLTRESGAVVEEFKARRIANTMAFDAGDYEWQGK